MLIAILFSANLIMSPDASWAIRGTDIFQPLQPGEVLITPEGETLVLDFANAIIHRYDENGKKSNTIGFKGRGPGGLTYPVNFFYDAPQLYVHDLIDNSINVFSLKGKFLEKFNCPIQGIKLIKASGGWIYGSWDHLRQGEPSTAIYWADHAFSQVKKLFNLKGIGNSGGLRMEITNGKPKANFSPISTAPLLAASPDASRVYLAEAQGFEVHIIDGSNGELIKTIKRQEQPVPFDEDWGNKQYEQTLEMVKEHASQVKVNKNFPKYFPIIRDMRVLPNGTLVINKWRGNPEKEQLLLAFDQNGTQTQITWSWEAIQRIAGAHNHWLFITTLEDEEAGLGRSKPDQLTKFLADHPIDYEGPIGRRISINN